ncbi:exonuclease domain-containing protein [Nocardiopsis alba]|uniref:Exonuclease family protein n=1 Tax=Nocardiopsis alba (strain ATCC BAA-2165 / BE74) TaxID=1205910 RepID=J7LB99_NOCAA|nr:exonuclease domain-containing protein [Nocardiopsis alba]AFR10933.1 exonuclease family protein [Nocardiopsis alba ATCC BAA-2165]
MSHTWTAIDFETANQDRGSVCAVGLVRVSDGRVVDRFGTLIRPPGPAAFFSRHNTAVHGLTADDVREAPTWEPVLERILDFSGGGPLVAHNAAFDMGALRQASAHIGHDLPALEYACTLAMSRRTWGLPDHRLPTVCAHIGHDIAHHHRAEDDAEAAARIMIAAMERYGTTSLPEALRAAGLPGHRTEPFLAGSAATVPVPPTSTAGEGRFERWQRAAQTPLPEPSPDADPNGPLFGRTVCVSGDVAGMDKTEVWKRVAEAGGRPAKNVTKKTDVLVVGSSDHGGKTSKHRQAETYIAKGQRIDIIDGRELLTRLGLTSA